MSEEKGQDFPEHWQEKTLGEILKVVRGVSFPSEDKKQSPEEDHIACLRTANVQETVDWDDLWYIPEKHISREEQYVREDDILISTANSYELVGKVSLVRDLPERATLGAFISLIRVPEGLDSKFFFYQLRSTEVRNEMRQRASTTTNISNISTSDLNDVPLGVPPLPEQRRIVAKIEELFSNLDAGMADLQAAGQQLERYRLSVLQAAVEGRLTADWRRIHDPEPADQLLERILEERREKWEEDYRAKYEAKDKELPKYWKNRYSPPEEPDLPDDLHEIPGSWEWTSLGYMCDMTSGGTPKRSNDEYWQGDIPWLKSGELNDGVVTEAEERITEKGLEESSTNIFPSGTLLVALYGATTGKLSILDFASATNQAVCGLFITDSLDTKYVFWYLRQFRPELLSKRFGGAQKNISQTILKQVPVPLPPLDEQKQIVDEIERLLSVADEAAATAEREHTRAERLRQSILKQAFSGRIVPHDDTDPPAIETNTNGTGQDASVDTGSSSNGDSSGADDVVAEDLQNDGDPGEQIEMDL